ncbi:MAG TPA: winged helix-turn-helix domain-containing protein [Candidatus Binatia bacterium]|nr:winged helix-turn-helix domain-containing protein [Candidatus Binatia bacterium]
MKFTVYAFGSFRLDVMRRLLITGSRICSLPERPFRILMLLLESNGALVERNVLIDALWPDEDIGENSLTQHIYLLRNLLVELGGKRSYIKTESRHGYRFTLPVAVIDDSADHFDPDVAAAVGRLIARDRFESFRAYCEGCYLLEKRTHESLLGAVSRFDEVVQNDPMHWQAYFGTARAYAFLGSYLYAPSREAFPKAKTAVLRALEIRPSGAAHALLSEITMFGEWDWAGAAAEMQTALELEPESAFVHNAAAWLAIGQGDFDRALFEARAALELEPASLFYRNVLARVFIHRADYGNAVALLSRVLELDATIDVAVENLAFAYTANGQPERAVRILLDRAQRGALADHMTGQLARAYGDSGHSPRAERIYRELQASAEQRYVAAWPMALAATGLGREDEALEQLSRGAREREAALVFLQRLTLFDGLKDDPEFHRIAAAVGPAGVT